MAVAVDDDMVVGYGRVQFRDRGPRLARPDLPPGYYLSGIVVADSHRRQGIGTSLCQTRIDWVTPRAHDIWYFTNCLNTASRRLHKRMGFCEVLEFTSPALKGEYGVVGYRLTDDPPITFEPAE
jgi:RimJ/RimL family protein N-acetyltransferase